MVDKKNAITYILREKKKENTMQVLDIAESFGKTVTLKREILGLTKSECAARAGITRVWLREIENGTCDVSLRKAVRLAEVLDISLDGLCVN